MGGESERRNIGCFNDTAENPPLSPFAFVSIFYILNTHIHALPKESLLSPFASGSALARCSIFVMSDETASEAAKQQDGFGHGSETALESSGDLESRPYESRRRSAIT